MKKMMKNETAILALAETHARIPLTYTRTRSH